MERQQDLLAGPGASEVTAADLPAAEENKPLCDVIAFAASDSLSREQMQNLQSRVKAYLQQHGPEPTKRLLFDTYKALRGVRRQGRLGDEETRYRAEEQIHLIFEHVVH